ncbi:ABC transporter substrate-binding protein [Marivibrio halodurans]|uniref:ABC transporter substrate-binding protein n=1 Tax=Marivibrio halodurans TaxID=2039722 RepID=A0A8J7V0K4_9PROT|nr:ABC transporter substrate-binding protein [Marivibrio halodurans]MBP5855420.1 ABC transporter substrate-binding protein [Marivibrio halodurans]
MVNTTLKSLMAGAAMAALGLAAAGSAAAQDDTYKIGVVTFLSGQAAESFGVPAWDGGKLLIEKLNAGEVPAPYDTVGFGGMKIEAIPIDEAGGATKQVQEFRNLVQRENVDAVIGYVSSGDCLAISPVADELEALTILYDCGTPRVFEDGSYEYVFRTAAHATMDNVSIARYLKARDMKVGTFAGLNQDYAWGHDSWRDFTASMAQLYPEAEVTAELFPAFGAGQYGTEISALMREGPDVVHSSNWGGDLQSFLLQALPRGLFQRSQVVLSAGDHSIPPLGKNMPEGVVLGARGSYGLLSPDTPLNDWWFKTYQDEYDVIPVQAPYRMVQALLGLKSAIEKAMEANGGNRPTKDEIAAALKGHEWESPAGMIQMKLGDGHQAIQPTAIGTTAKDENGDTILVDIERFAAECVNPPPGQKSVDWINAGFQGAKCE